MKTIYVLFLVLFGNATSHSQRGPIVSTSTNQQLYANAFAGSDIGAQITNAVSYASTNSLTCNIRVTPGTISTTFQLPQNCSIYFAPGNYTVAAQIWAAHRDTNWTFDHAIFIDAYDAGHPAFLVGKQCSGTVNTSGITVTYVSGCNFNQVDVGDIFNIAGGQYNIASVTPPDTLTLVAPAGTNTSVPFEITMGGVSYIGQSQTVTINNLTLYKTSGTTTATDGLHIEGASDVRVNNATVEGFSNAGSYALNMIGSISDYIFGFKTNSNAACLNMGGRKFGDRQYDSNDNSFFKLDCASGGGSKNGATMILGASGGASGNNFYGLHIEGNTNPNQIEFARKGACRNRVFGFWEESNGAAKGSTWENLSGCQNGLYGGWFDHPNGIDSTAMTTSGSGSYSILEDIDLGSGYQYGWTFSAATGRVFNVNTGTATNQGNPLNIFNNGTIGLVSGATISSASGIPSGSCSVGSLYTNTGASSTSTVLYLCYPANTWNPVLIPRAH